MSVFKELNLKRIQGTIGSNRVNNAVTRMSPMRDGHHVDLRLSDKAMAEMSKFAVTHVQYAWGTGADGKVQLLAITPSADGLKLRYLNDSDRPHVFVPTDDVGRVACNGGSLACPEERFDGKELAFRVPDSLRFGADALTKEKKK
jgi:hypothetical protein